MSEFTKLNTKIQNKSAIIGSVGIGYVGRALIEGCSQNGFTTIGYGRTLSKVKTIQKEEISNFTATTRFEDLKACDVICVCVPTPVNDDKTPDLGPIHDALNNVAKILRPEQLVILESSVAPGTTRRIALPHLKKSGLTIGEDYFLGFSPERIDPGNKTYQFTNIPKVVAGYDECSKNLCHEFYRRVVSNVSVVSTLEAAELTKVFENTFRLVNISLVNELRSYANAIGVNMWEVVDAAATKPFGFLPHYPGPGIGGHCIPVDPHYLREDAKKLGIQLNLIKSAADINDRQTHEVTAKIKQILKKTNGTKKRYKVLLLGLAYKPDIDDMRESPAIRIWHELEKHDIDISFHDPYISSYRDVKGNGLTKQYAQQHDIVVIVTNHSNVPYDTLLTYNVPILDTRRTYKKPHEHVYHL